MQVGGARAAQGRIVGKEDLLARIYTMPANFGKIFRAAVYPNPNNPLATLLFVISRNESGNLIISPDSLKKNLAKYLNSYRMVSDAIDILDAHVINFQVEFVIVVDPEFNKALVLGNVLSKLRKYFNIKYFEINQAINMEDLRSVIFNNPGVISIQSLNVRNISGAIGDRTYSDIQYDLVGNTQRGFVVGPPGSIFELKYKNNDLIGSAV
jgi:hypothetical protein